MRATHAHGEKVFAPFPGLVRFVSQSLVGFLRTTFSGGGQYLLAVLLAWMCYLFINHHLLSTVRVTGTSMRPTLSEAEVRLLHRWAYYWRNPQARDIVVIKDPADEGYSIKRIIAVPGDSIDFRYGAVYVNGRRISEPYLQKGTFTTPCAQKFGRHSFVCGSGEYFLLGDNRMNSLDSRAYGPVTRSRILGAVFL